MTPRMHCVALGCTQGIDSCASRHLTARRVESQGRTGWHSPEFESTHTCATCGTGASLAGLARMEPRAPSDPVMPAHGALLYTYRGEQKTAKQLSETGARVPSGLIYHRHHVYGWTVEEAVEVEVRRQVRVR